MVDLNQFSPRDTFGTDEADTRAVLQALVNYLYGTGTVDDLDAAVGKTSSNPTGHSYWTALVERLKQAYDALPDDTPITAEALGVATGVPLFDDVLAAESLEPFDDPDVAARYFTKQGRTARALYNPTPVQRANSVVSTGDDLPERLVPAGASTSGGGGGGDDSSNDGEGREDDGDPDGDLAELRRAAQQARLGAGGGGAVRRSGSLLLPPSSAALASPLDVGDISTHVSTLLHSAQDVEELDLTPEEALSRKMAHKYRAKSNKEVVKQTALNASTLMPLECAEACILGKYVDYDKVFAHDPGASNLVSLNGLDELGFLPAPAPASAIPDPHAFLIVLEKVGGFTTRFYPHRKAEFDTYRRWFSGQVARRPDQFEAYKSYDYNYRKNLGAPGYGNSLLAAIGDTAALLSHLSSFVAAPASSTRRRAASPPGSSPRTKKARSGPAHLDDWPASVCHRYNHNVPHAQSECEGARPVRAHLCVDCRMDDHRMGDAKCPRPRGGRGSGGGGGNAPAPKSVRK
ncbi:hypothetical protein JCM8097_006450 [Rhodosporidiobolus ruineniae]